MRVLLQGRASLKACRQTCIDAEMYVDADPADVRCPRRTQTPNRVYVWIGAVCPAAYATAARYHAKLLLKYEQPHLLQQYQGSQEPAILEVSSHGGKAWVIVIDTLM